MAVTWQGKREVSVEDVPDPRIEHPTDAIIRVTSTNICGSDLHLYETLTAQIQLRMGQANVEKWVDDIMPLLDDDDPLGVDDFATHRLPLTDAPYAYEIFQKKQDGAIKIVLHP